jgi:hypothetical protein
MWRTLLILTALPVALSSGLVDPAIVGDGGFLQSLDGEAWAVSGADGLTNFGGVVPGSTNFSPLGVSGVTMISSMVLQVIC